MKSTRNIKNDNGQYKPDAFHKICKTFFNYAEVDKKLIKALKKIQIVIQ